MHTCAAPTTAGRRSCACPGPPATRAARQRVLVPDFHRRRERLPAARRRVGPAHRGRRDGRGHGAPRCLSTRRRGRERSPPPTSPSRARRRASPRPPRGGSTGRRTAPLSWTLVRERSRDQGCPLRHPNGRIRRREPRVAAHRGRRSDLGDRGERHVLPLAASAAPTRSPASLTTQARTSLMRTTDGGSDASLRSAPPRRSCSPPHSRPGSGSWRPARTASRSCRAMQARPGRRSAGAWPQTSHASGRCRRHWCSRSGRRDARALGRRRCAVGGRSASRPPRTWSTSRSRTPFVGYAVDAAGTVLRTDNGGVSWQILNTGYSATPQAVLALDRRTCC